MRYRDMPRFVLRRMDRMAGEINTFLIVIAIGLAMLNVLCLTERLVDSIPPVARHSAP